MSISFHPSIGPIFLVVAAFGMGFEGVCILLKQPISPIARAVWLIALGVLLILGL